MIRRLNEWLRYKWAAPDANLLSSYAATYNSPHGQRVLQHLLDSVYFKICESKDPIDLATHNGRRSVVQEILENIDASENPKKYEIAQTVEEVL